MLLHSLTMIDTFNPDSEDCEYDENGEDGEVMMKMVKRIIVYT